MSNQEDNTNNRKLKDLLDKTGNSEHLPQDDFEREALEGFAMLENDEDALELKRDLDKRIYSEVFSEQKRSSKNSYWLAAAGLFLVIGFSVYFVSTRSDSEKSNLAITSPSKDAGKALQEVISKETKKNEDLKFKSAESTGQAHVAAGGKAQASKVKPSSEIVNGDEGAVTLSQSGKGTSSDLATVSGYQSQPAVSAPAEPAKEEISRAKAENEKNTLDLDDAVAGSDAKKAITRKDAEPEAEIALRKDKAGEKNDQKPAVQLSSQGAVTYNNSAPSAGIMAPPSNTGTYKTEVLVVNPCYYKGGDEALKKEVKEKLSVKNLDKKFNATLFINEKRVVEKVKLTKIYDLSPEEQKQVIELLKTLDKFYFTITSADKVLKEFKLVYRP